MIDQKEGERLANNAVNEYLSACNCNTIEDAGNAIMKLASMCGLAMCATVGYADAVERLQGVTDYIKKSQRRTTWRQETVQ